MKCPDCGSTEHLEVITRMWRHLVLDDPDDVQTTEAIEADEEWDDLSPAACRECGWTGRALYLETSVRPFFDEILDLLEEAESDRPPTHEERVRLAVHATAKLVEINAQTEDEKNLGITIANRLKKIFGWVSNQEGSDS